MTPAPSRVSVVMPVFRGLPFLPDQVESIVGQLPPDGLLRIRDDGSDDGSHEWLMQRASLDGRIQLLPDRKHLGVVAGVEALLRDLPRGVVFLADQDDVWHPGKVERCLEALSGDASLAIHDAVRIDARGEELPHRLFERRGWGGGVATNLWKNTFTGCCMAFRTDLLDRALPFPRRIPMHDQWLGILALRHGGVRWIREPLLSYRVHSGNATATGGGKPAAGMVRRILWRIQALQALGR
ncbi:MAG: glycosyltransferase [Fibrobacteria bacterium]|nr:glycosyltransferase [Fibrobacteria bacterium]